VSNSLIKDVKITITVRYLSVNLASVVTIDFLLSFNRQSRYLMSKMHLRLNKRVYRHRHETKTPIIKADHDNVVKL
jgi:hypothetical protein